MDFSYLLDLAKQNEEHAKEAVQIKRYSTQVSASKKEPRSRVQSQAIRSFLARKDQEEKCKKLEELRKKEVLLSLRAQDRKSNARVQAMLNRTKGASKAVLDEVRNSMQTAVTATGLNEQPDEDDYGYVSHEASAQYKKLLDKYGSDRADDKFDRKKVKSDKELKNTKDRVKDAISKIEEDEHGGQPRKRHHHKSAVLDKDAKDQKSNNKDVHKTKPRPKALPPEAAMSFDQILKLAATKQHEPIKIEKKIETNEKKAPEPERLMTKKEKDEAIRKKQEERERQLRKEGKLPPITAPAPPLATKSKERPLSAKASAAKEPAKAGSLAAKPVAKVSSAKAVGQPVDGASRSADSRKASGPQRLGDSAMRPNSAKPNAVPQRPPPSKAGAAKPSAQAAPSRNNLPSGRAQQPLSRGPPAKGKALAPRPSTSRQFPPYRDIRPVHQPYKRAYESDDEEQDSDLDDFIDDGPDGAEDYSRHIREIFGYDKSRYRRIESDESDDCMESSFAQVMKEEVISTRIGIQEDLEEERLQREEEERKRKAAKRAKTKK